MVSSSSSSSLDSSIHLLSFAATVVSIVIEDAVRDGILVKTNDGLLQLPSTNTKVHYPDNSPDWYCYECHTAGDVRKCETCNRVFHVSCIKTDAEKQELWDKLDYHVDKKRNTLTYKEVDQKVDQTQNNAIADDSNLRRFCYGCRLIHRGQSKMTAISKEELHYLLTFAYNRVHSWIQANTFSLQDDSLPKPSYITDNIDLSVSNLLRLPTTIAKLKTKLDYYQYNLFEEFLRDILDIGHNLALVFGRHSAEYEASNYLFADAQFEIGEIKTCRDCYRHSNEKFDHFWFTIPCVTRKHELVYAKAPGFTFWPAKVVKINDDGKYDVRFFGVGHTRSIINLKNIEPIDKNIKKLIHGKAVTGSLLEAMNELKEHQKRLELPMNLFTFEAEKEIRENNTCKFIPNKEVGRPKQVGRPRSASTKNGEEESKPLQKKTSNGLVKTAAPKIDKPQPATPTSSRKVTPKEPPGPPEIKKQKCTPGSGPAPKRIKLERERKLQEEATNSETLSNSFNLRTPTINNKKGTKHPALTKLDTRLSFAKSVEEAHQVAICIMQEELECFQKKVKQIEAKHQEEVRQTKRNQWVRDKCQQKSLCFPTTDTNNFSV